MLEQEEKNAQIELNNLLKKLVSVLKLSVEPDVNIKIKYLEYVVQSCIDIIIKTHLIDDNTKESISSIGKITSLYGCSQFLADSIRIATEDLIYSPSLISKYSTELEIKELEPSLKSFITGDPKTRENKIESLKTIEALLQKLKTFEEPKLEKEELECTTEFILLDYNDETVEAVLSKIHNCLYKIYTEYDAENYGEAKKFGEFILSKCSKSIAKVGIVEISSVINTVEDLLIAMEKENKFENLDKPLAGDDNDGFQFL